MILITLFCLFVIGWILTVFEHEFLYYMGMAIRVIVGIFIALCLITIPYSQYLTKVEIERYHALKDTLEKSRDDNVSEIERAAILREISEYNKDLATVKYMNDTLFDLWIYDGLADLEYLE